MALHPLIIDVEVVKEPGSHAWFIEPSGRLKVHHKEPASRDANEFITKTLAEKININHSYITVIHGVEDPIKRIKIGHDITKDKLLELLHAQHIKK